MTDEIKVPEVPVVETPETPEKPLIDNPRQLVEKAIIVENQTFPDVPVEEVAPEKKEEETPPVSEVDRIKLAVQKRIDKVVAKQKSAEEELVDAKAEIARLRAQPDTTKTPAQKDDTAPTPEQVEAYILKMREEGNAKEEIAATRYLIKLEKDAAVKAVQDEQVKIKQEGEARLQRESAALLDLAKDYVAYDDNGQVDMKSDLTLANQRGKLFETAMALYNDPDIHREYYNDPDRALGFRKAVQDANRELHAQGLIKTPKVDVVENRQFRRQVLADPDAVEVEETPTPSNSNLLSDAEKVREEIKSRQRMRNSRKPQ